MRTTLDILFPRACLFCHRYTREAHHLCQACANELPILSHYCQKCAQILHSGNNELTCGDCLKDPPPYHQLHAVFPYLHPLPRLVAQFKFEANLTVGQLFSQFLLHSLRLRWLANHPKPDLIVPVPLHSERLKERGFNQAMEIAKPIAKALAIPIDTHIKRDIATLPQSSLSAKDRLRNIKNAFKTAKSYQGLHVAILDDVVTTGQTIRALADIIDADRIDIWCIARCSL